MLEQYLYEKLDGKYVLGKPIGELNNIELDNIKIAYKLIESNEYKKLEKSLNEKTEEIERLNRKLKNRDEIIDRYFKKIKPSNNIGDKNSIITKLSGCGALKNITLDICNRSIYQTQKFVVELTVANNTAPCTIKKYIRNSTIEELFPNIIHIADPKKFKVLKAFINSKGT